MSDPFVEIKGIFPIPEIEHVLGFLKERVEILGVREFVISVILIRLCHIRELVLQSIDNHLMKIRHVHNTLSEVLLQGFDNFLEIRLAQRSTDTVGAFGNGRDDFFGIETFCRSVFLSNFDIFVDQVSHLSVNVNNGLVVNPSMNSCLPSQR